MKFCEDIQRLNMFVFTLTFSRSLLGVAKNIIKRKNVFLHFVPTMYTAHRYHSYSGSCILDRAGGTPCMHVFVMMILVSLFGQTPGKTDLYVS